MVNVPPNASIVILGSGNVATHLTRALNDASCRVVQVYSRSITHARRLAETIAGCEAIDDLGDVTPEADYYIISVADAAVAEIASGLPGVKGVVAHTSGSVPLSVVACAGRSAAVLYPLQTFSRDAAVDVAGVPFFTEASDDRTLDRIDSLARLLSRHVYHADSSHRRVLHIAGVLSCNFVNYLWDRTAAVLESGGYDFTVVGPLIQATLDKALALGPHNSQTGPAMRCDLEVMRNQMAALDPETANIYRVISNAILNDHQLNCQL